MINVKKIYNKPRQLSWAVLNRAGDRAELFYYYQPKMDYIRELYKQKDFILLDDCLNKLRVRSIYYAKKGLGFAVTEELFRITLELLRFQGFDEFAEILQRNTDEAMLKPIIKMEENNES